MAKEMDPENTDQITRLNMIYKPRLASGICNHKQEAEEEEKMHLKANLRSKPDQPLTNRGAFIIQDLQRTTPTLPPLLPVSEGNPPPSLSHAEERQNRT